MSGELVSDRARAAVFAVAALSLVAVVVSLVWGRKLVDRQPSPHDSYGRGPLGTRVFVESLSDVGIRYRRETSLQEVIDDDDLVVFLAPDSTLLTVNGKDHTLGGVLRERKRSGRASVVVLPKWELDPFGHADPLPADIEAAYLDAVDVDDVLTATHVGTPFDRPSATPLVSDDARRRAIEIPYARVLSGGVPFERIEQGALVASDTDELVYVVSDSDLVSNFALTRGNNASIVSELIRSLHRREVVIDETFHGRSEPRRLAEALGEWPGVLVLIHGALLAVASLLAGRVRFGPPRRAVRGYGRGPGEAIAVAADVLTLGRSPARLVRRYVELILRDVHRRTRPGSRGGAFTTAEAVLALDRADQARGRPAVAGGLFAEALAFDDRGRARERLSRALALARQAHAFRNERLASRAGGST